MSENSATPSGSTGDSGSFSGNIGSSERDGQTLSEALPRAPIWRQQIFVSGRSLALLERNTNFVRTSHEIDGIVIRGDGPYIPHIIGSDWAAGCVKRRPGDAHLSDIISLVKALLGCSFILELEVPDGIEEFMAWVHGDDE